MNETITVEEARELWNGKHPNDEVTGQTIRNWAYRYKLGRKGSELFPRSRWVIVRDRFEDFVKEPEKYLRMNVKEV